MGSVGQLGSVSLILEHGQNCPSPQAPLLRLTAAGSHLLSDQTIQYSAVYSSGVRFRCAQAFAS